VVQPRYLITSSSNALPCCAVVTQAIESSVEEWPALGITEDVYMMALPAHGLMFRNSTLEFVLHEMEMRVIY
jgi:hypothetical protein